jgi:hypothetical protein
MLRIRRLLPCIAIVGLNSGTNVQCMYVLRNGIEVAKLAKHSQFVRLLLRHWRCKNLKCLAWLFANNFSTRAETRSKIFFLWRRVSQLQCKPEVRANRFSVIGIVLKQLLKTPLTRVLAGVKSATRLKLQRCLKCEFGREISDIQNKFAVRLRSSLRLKAI